MSMKLTTTPFHYQGDHSQPGRRGTILSFDVLLDHRPADGEGNMWVAGAVVHNGKDTGAKIPSDPSACSVKAFGKDPLATLEKLAENLRRVADSIDAQLDKGVIVPIALHRKKAAPKTPDELDAILGNAADDEEAPHV